MASDEAFQPDWASAPGDTIVDLLEEQSLPPAVFAERIGCDPEQLNELLQGRAELTAEFARLLEVHLGSSSAFWLNRESQYRSDLVRLGKDVQTDREWLRQLPLRDMIRFGWLSSAIPPAERMAACLDFFGVPDRRTWRAVYGLPLEMAAFRTSPTIDSRPGAVAAWLRQGELEGRAIPCAAWNRDRFHAALSSIRPLTKQKEPTRFIPRLKNLCSACGVAVVVLRSPVGCRASGATRFLSPDKALLLLSFRYLSDDHFWFTFFHEAAHLLLHGPSALFLEAPDMLKSAQEQEADAFAAYALIPPESRSELDRVPLRPLDLIRFATRVGVSPGIVVGQLQHQGRLRRDRMNRLKRRFRWNQT